MEHNSFIYIPEKVLKYNEHKDIWNKGIFDMEIVLINYHSIQISTKEVEKLLYSVSNKKGVTEKIEENKQSKLNIQEFD